MLYAPLNLKENTCHANTASGLISIMTEDSSGGDIVLKKCIRYNKMY
jgi:hypothetical protein